MFFSFFCPLSLPRYWYESINVDSHTHALLSRQVPDNRTFGGYLYPSGKVSTFYRPRGKTSEKDKIYESTRAKFVCFRRSHWDADRGIVRETLVREEEPSTLGLSTPPNCHIQKMRKYGLRGISSKARTFVKESAYVLHRRYPRRLGFYTLTCPYTDEQSIYLYNQNINYIVRSYFQELKRAYEKQGCCWSYIAVIEIQTERYDNTGVPALHIHYISPCYVAGSTSFVLTSDEIRDIWRRVLGNTMGRRVDCSAAVDSQVIYKSAAGYIAKYLSKGTSCVSFLAVNCPDQLPSQWWSCSNNVRMATKMVIMPLPQRICDYYMAGGGNEDSSPVRLLYRREISVNLHGQMFVVGMSAQMSVEGISALRVPLRWNSALAII